MTKVDVSAENRPTQQGHHETASHVHRRRASVVRTLDDFLRAASIRSVVYVGDQSCPFAEEFDGNDFCAMHILGWIDSDATACLRVRFFADFAKVERLAVLPKFRRSPIAFDIVRFALQVIVRKGYRRAYGHARVGLEPFWARFGARPIGTPGSFAFSGQRYTEMVVDLEPVDNAIRFGVDPLVSIRPEGAWDTPGVLEAGLKENTPRNPAAVFAPHDNELGTVRDRISRSFGAWSIDAQVAWLRWAGAELRSSQSPQS